MVDTIIASNIFSNLSYKWRKDYGEKINFYTIYRFIITHEDEGE